MNIIARMADIAKYHKLKNQSDSGEATDTHTATYNDLETRVIQAQQQMLIQQNITI